MVEKTLWYYCTSVSFSLFEWYMLITCMTVFGCCIIFQAPGAIIKMKLKVCLDFWFLFCPVLIQLSLYSCHISGAHYNNPSKFSVTPFMPHLMLAFSWMSFNPFINVYLFILILVIPIWFLNLSILVLNVLAEHFLFLLIFNLCAAADIYIFSFSVMVQQIVVKCVFTWSTCLEMNVPIFVC